MVNVAASKRSATEVARVRAEQSARDTRRRVIIIAVAAIAALAIVAVIWTVIAGESRRIAAVEAAASQPITGVRETPELSAEHVEALPEPTPAEIGGTVLPPAGGPHDPVLQNCGVYIAPVATAKAIHSLEHGAVWITYRSGLDQQDVNALTTLAKARPYALLSPMDALAAPVVLTAWGIQLEVNDASDPRVEVFLDKYIQGPQTPEPGAPCTGGFGGPA